MNDNYGDEAQSYMMSAAGSSSGGSSSPAKKEEPCFSNISGFGVKSQDRGIILPTVDKNFYVKKDTQEMLEVVEELSMQSPQNILLTGPQGCGKTELAMWYAALNERKLLIMNCATIRETKDWFGYRDAKDGSVFWHKSDFVRAVELGNVVVVLDEFNRLHTTLHNSLYPLLDARRSTFVEELDGTVRVAKGTIFFATANIGFSHVGTHTLDSAIEDRFGYRIDIEFPEKNKESDILQNKTGITKTLADKLAMFGKDIRSKSKGVSATLSRAVSTRQLLQTAILMNEFKKRKMDVVKAVEYTIVPYYSKDGGADSEQAQILQLVQGIFADV